MKAAKAFDCVEMKDAIQAKLRKEREGMTDEQVRLLIRRRLETSNTPIARLWRTLNARKAEQDAGRPMRRVPPQSRGTR
jgi:predicted metalloprotease